jgi:RNase adapter protein RapZ
MARATRPAPPIAVPASSSRFIVLTGLSGSGKSQAIRALEDLGYFCVDNLPTTLIPTLAQLSRRAGKDMARTAVVVDVREGEFLSHFPSVFRKLQKTPGLNPVLIFLEARDEALVRRFSETRRPHPLAPDRSAIEGLREERKRLAPIRRIADEIIDTSEMTVHELRRAFLAISRGRAEKAQLIVTVLSFGFKHGVPVDVDLLFDVRFMPNPHFVPRLRKHTGQHRAVVDYVDQQPTTREFLERVTGLLQFLLPLYRMEGKSYLTIGVGCTGGRHRSVVIANRLRAQLATMKGVRIRVRHRDIAYEP